MGFSALSVRRRREQRRPGWPQPRQRCRCRLYLVGHFTSLPKTGRTPSCTCTVETCQPQVLFMTLSPVSRVSDGLFVRQDSNLRPPACGPALSPTELRDLCSITSDSSSGRRGGRTHNSFERPLSRRVPHHSDAFHGGARGIRTPGTSRYVCFQRAEREGIEPSTPFEALVFKTSCSPIRILSVSVTDVRPAKQLGMRYSPPSACST